MKTFDLNYVGQSLSESESKFHNNWRVGRAGSPAVWSHHSLSKPAMKCQNSDFKMGDNEESEGQALAFFDHHDCSTKFW